jgi:hypothetical protein
MDWGISNKKGWLMGASMSVFLRQRQFWYRRKANQQEVFCCGGCGPSATKR